MSKIYYQYLQDLAKYPRLSKSEEIQLIYKAQNGDERALETLITSNLRFVVSIAKKYINQGVELLDLISVGNLGLIKSIERFDPKSGNKLISYSVWWIKQKILELIDKQSRLIRLPLNKSGAAREIETKLKNLDYDKPGLVAVSEICEEYDLTEYELITLLSTYHMNGGYYRDDIISSCEILITDSFFDNITEEEVETIWNKELGILSEREKFIAEKYYDFFGESWTLQDIGDELGLTRERVRQIKEKITDKLERSVSLKQFEKPESLEYIRYKLTKCHFNILNELFCYRIKEYRVITEVDETSENTDYNFEDELLEDLYESL